MAYCAVKASTCALAGTIEAYQAQTLVLNVNATNAFAIASTICRILQPLLVQTTTSLSALFEYVVRHERIAPADDFPARFVQCVAAAAVADLRPA